MTKIILIAAILVGSIMAGGYQLEQRYAMEDRV